MDPTNFKKFLDAEIIVFFDFEKVEKILRNFREILRNFSKKIAEHKIKLEVFCRKD